DVRLITNDLFSGGCSFYFFSSRRRHTRSKRDWSSDVCSSDLVLSRGEETDMSFTESEVWQSIPAVQKGNVIEIDTAATSYSDPRSEERRVGKEGRSWMS